MNKKQRLVLAIFIPIIIFFITFTIAYYTGSTCIIRRTITGSPFGSKTIYNPFNWEKTWYIWLLSAIIIFIFEYKLFADKKMLINKKKKDNLS